MTYRIAIIEIDTVALYRLRQLTGGDLRLILDVVHMTNQEHTVNFDRRARSAASHHQPTDILLSRFSSRLSFDRYDTIIDGIHRLL